MIELWFLFSLIWSICASVDEDSRKKMDNFLREIEGQFPAKVMLSSVYRSASKNFCLFVLIKCDRIKRLTKSASILPFRTQFMNTTWTPNKRPGLCGKINSGVDGVTTPSMYKTKLFTAYLEL